MSDLGELITSKRLGCDIWLIKDPAFKPSDGLAWYYPEELSMIDKMDDDELRKVQEVKLVFPGSHVRDFKLKEEKMDTQVELTFSDKRMPPLPFAIQYTQEEVDEIVKVWPTKYPKGAGRAYSDEQVQAAGYKNNAKFGLVVEDTIERFLKLTTLKWMRTNTRPGSDKVDFIVEGWRVDGKGRIEPRGWRGNDYRLKVPTFQVYDQPGRPPSPINAYWWGQFSRETLRCELYGWRPRKDYHLIDQGADIVRERRGLTNGLAIFRKEGTQIGRNTFLFQDNNDLGADEMFSEEEFFTRKGD